MRRSTTPTQTIAAGADYLVIGRPIRAASDPAAAAAAILKRNAGGLRCERLRHRQRLRPSFLFAKITLPPVSTVYLSSFGWWV